MEKSEIRETRIKKERELLQKTVSQNYTLDLSESNDLVELTTHVHGFPVIFYLDLPDRYPFEPPKVSVSPHSSLTTLTEFSESENILEQVLGESWLPVKSLIEVSDKLVLYAQQSFKPKDKALIIDVFSIKSLWSTLSVILFSLLIRVSVIFLPHSNSGGVPYFSYGEYESYRHWMEITYKFPASLWYEQRDYLPLKNPPLNSAFCWALSFASILADPSSILNGDSRGYVSAPHKLFMRMGVIFLEILFFTSSILLFFRVYYRNLTLGVKNASCAILLISPCLALISHVLFSVNIVGIGLSLISVILVIQDYLTPAMAVLTLAVNFKVECLVYGIPIVVAMGIRIYYKSMRSGKSAKPGMRTIVFCSEYSFGIISMIAGFFITSAIIWSPWLHSVTNFVEVVNIITDQTDYYFPKQPTFFALVNVFYEIRSSHMLVYSLCLTTISSSPFLYFLIKRKPFGLSFLYCLSGVSLSSYLFFIHEDPKFILMPLMPLSLLTIIDFPEVFRLASVAFAMSLYPSMAINETRSAYIVILIFFYVISSSYIDTINYFQNRKGFELRWWYVLFLCVHSTELIDYPLLENILNLFVFASLVGLWCWLVQTHYLIREEIAQKYHIEKRFRKKNKTT